MFTSQPRETTTVMAVSDLNKLEVELNHQNHEVPDKQRAFLAKMGWQVTMNHPDTNEELFRKPPPVDASDFVRNNWDWELGQGYWYWYEAVAYEFTKFIGIDDDSGTAHSGDGASTTSTPMGQSL